MLNNLACHERSRTKITLKALSQRLIDKKILINLACHEISRYEIKLKAILRRLIDMSMPSVFLLRNIAMVTEIHFQVEPTMHYRQVKKHHISRRYHTSPDPFTVSIVPKDKILLSSHRRVIHLNNNCLLKDLSIPLEHRLHLNILELPRALCSNSALYLIRTMVLVNFNLAHPARSQHSVFSSATPVKISF